VGVANLGMPSTLVLTRWRTSPATAGSTLCCKTAAQCHPRCGTSETRTCQCHSQTPLMAPTTSLRCLRSFREAVGVLLCVCVCVCVCVTEGGGRGTAERCFFESSSVALRMDHRVVYREVIFIPLRDPYYAAASRRAHIAALCQRVRFVLA
jgi:hypothetical protein